MQMLDGLLVVSMEQAVAAPFCSGRLARSGARVIKIERPDGDNARGYDKAAKGDSSYFTWLNQGKQSVIADIKSPDGKELLMRLLERADVFIQNFSPGAIDRAGFDYDTLSKRNPRLIRCDVSGYGPSPTLSKKRGYDLLIQAESGIISCSGAPGAPGRIGVSICDIGAGMTAYQGILEALIKRGQTGKGSQFSVSLFDVAAEWMTVPLIHSEYGNGAPEPAGLNHPSISPYGAFKTANNQDVLISIQNEREWKRLATDVLLEPHLLEDKRFKSNVSRVQHRSALDEILCRIIGSLKTEEFTTRLEDNKIAYGLLTATDNLINHPALRLSPVINNKCVTMDLPAHPINWEEEVNGSFDVKTPILGEHTKQVMDEFLGTHND